MAVEFRAEIDGLEDLLKVILVEGRDVAQEVGRTLYAEANTVFDLSQDIVPIDTGALRSSGVVRQPEVEGDEISVTIQYGGAAAPYAVIQHENLEYFHEPPTRSKYLEAPLLERLSEVKESLEVVVHRAIQPDFSSKGED